MRKSRQEAAQTRERIVAAASSRFRNDGIDATGLADVMRDAGLTHGGFYKHFESKEQLVAEACEEMFTCVVTELVQRVSSLPADQRLQAFIEQYLSIHHRNAREYGCGLAAIGSELCRQGPAVKHKATAGLEFMIGAMAGLHPDGDSAATRARVQTYIATMTGAMMLARAVDDERMSADILANTLRDLTRDLERVSK